MRIPQFTGATAWVNSEPLDPAALRGRAVLVNFWTLTCINWLRQEPYVRAWSNAYRDDGLVVIGVHTPEFKFEHDADLVRAAVAERAIDYPVAVDSDYAVWDAFANRYWPALYFADRDGMIRDEHFGEGRYEECEQMIQRLLGIERAPVPVRGEGVEAAADWDHLRTGETYLGQWRGEGRDDRWWLTGEWATEPERLVLEQGGGSIAFRFHARDVHLVLNAPAPIPFTVRLDGAPPGEHHGVDVDPEGNGVLNDGRMCQLIRVHDTVGERTVEITFHDAGAEAYAFTFG